MKQIPLVFKILSSILTPRNRKIHRYKEDQMQNAVCTLAKVKGTEIKRPNMVQKYNIRSMTCCLKLENIFCLLS